LDGIGWFIYTKIQLFSIATQLHLLGELYGAFGVKTPRLRGKQGLKSGCIFKHAIASEAAQAEEPQQVDENYSICEASVEKHE